MVENYKLKVEVGKFLEYLSWSSISLLDATENSRNYKNKVMIKKFALYLLIALPLSLTAQSTFDLDSAKKAFAWKKRRIITNNDGIDTKVRKPADTLNPKSFTDRRLKGLIGTQVDAVFYSDGVFASYTHQSEISDVRTAGLANTFLTEYLIREGTDALTEVIKFCRSNNMDVFWSIRMNDSHDSHDTTIMSSWKKNNQDALMGTYEQKFAHLDGWSAVNYENYKVRKKLLEVIEDVVSRYDIDGIELDFFKHLMLFRETLNGQKATKEQLSLMTSFIHDIRGVLDTYGQIKRKPILLTVRVPDSFEYNEALGIDLQTWLSRNYVDILVTSDYFKLNSYEFLAKVSKQFNVPIYPCLTPRRIHNGGKPGTKSDLPKWRAEAYSALKAGLNGIYVFNRFQARDRIYREIGNLRYLETLEREQNFESGICETCWFKPQRWVKEGDQFKGTGDAYLKKLSEQASENE